MLLLLLLLLLLLPLTIYCCCCCLSCAGIATFTEDTLRMLHRVLY
jgi:hypothetical protein